MPDLVAMLFQVWQKFFYLHTVHSMTTAILLNPLISKVKIMTIDNLFKQITGVHCNPVFLYWQR